MKVLFDHQIYNDQNYGGISRYFYEITKNIREQGEECRNSILFSENEFTNDREIFNSRHFIPFNFKGRGVTKKYINQKYSELLLQRGDFDIFHPTYYDTYHLNRKHSSKKPFVLTFYDLIHEKFGKIYPNILTNVEHVISSRRQLLTKSSAIISISQSTKNDIVEFYGVDESKIFVTHLANSMEEHSIEGNKHLGDYILYVGNRDGYKNFSGYINSIQPLLIREKSLKLICAGGGAFRDDEKRLLSSLGVASQVSQMPINDKILSKLYHDALFFVFPSIYEGFGIPILEAFSSNCPAILSNVSSLPEVGGNAALYVDPHDFDDMLAKTEDLLYNTALRDEFRIRGKKRVAEYSWSQTASQTLDIYKSLL